jgi:WD40 repeat protein
VRKTFLLSFFLIFLDVFALSQEIYPQTTIGLGTLTSVVASPDGTKLVTGTQNGTYLWNTLTWDYELLDPITSNNARYIKWDVSGRTFAAWHGENFHLWNAETYRLESKIVGSRFVGDLAFSPDNRKIAYFESWDQWVVVRDWQSSNAPFVPQSSLWDLLPWAEGNPQFPEGTVFAYPSDAREIRYLNFTHDSDVLISVGDGGEIVEANVVSQAIQKRQLPNVNKVFSIAFDEGFTSVAAIIETGDVKIWSYPDLQEKQTLSGYELSDVAFGQNDNVLYGAVSNGDLMIWNLNANTQERLGSRDPLMHSSFEIVPLGSSDNVAVFGSFDSTLVVWDTANKELLKELPYFDSFIGRLQVSEDEKSVIVDAALDIGHEYGLPDGRYIRELPQNHGCTFGSIIPNTDRRFIAMEPDGESGSIQIYDESCFLKVVLSGHSSQIFSIQFSPDGSRAFSYSGDGTARVWDVATGQELFLVKQPNPNDNTKLDVTPNSATFSYDNKLLVTTDGVQIVVFNLENKQIVKGWKRNEYISGLAFSPNSQLLLGSTGLGEILAWDYSSGDFLYKLIGHKGRVVSMIFLKDSKHVVTTSDDGTIRFWALP